MLDFPIPTIQIDKLNNPQLVPYSPIFINEASHEYLNAFNYYFGNYDMNLNPDNNKITYFFITNNIGVSKPCDQWGFYNPLLNQRYYIEQEYYALDTAYSVKRVIVTTDSIQVNNEFTSEFNGRYLSNANSQTPVVLDLSPLNIKNSNVRQIKWVNEFGNNRLADLLSNENLKRITLYFYFQDSFGNNHQLNISKYQNIFLKLAFQNKKLYLN
jgi:hypothetical protein